MAIPATAAPERLVSQRALTNTMAACAVRRDRAAARRFVLADFPDDEGTMPPALKAARERIVRTLVPCMGADFRSVTMDGLTLRGFLAAGLLTADGGLPLRAARALPDVPAAPVARGGAIGVRFWSCVAAAAPGPAADLIAADDASSAEGHAFAALSPALEGCAPAGGAMRIKPGNVRPQVAAAVYRRVAGAPVGVQ